MRLKNKIALMTRSGGGLGRGIAKMLASEGARVIVIGRKAEDIVDRVNEVKGAGRYQLETKGGSKIC